MYNTDEIITVFFPGHMSSRTQATNYTNKVTIKITDEITEEVHIPNAPLILHNVFPAKDLDDIGYGFTLNPLHMLFKVKSFVVNEYCNIQGASLGYSYITEDNVSGKKDVEQNIKAIEECVKLHPDNKIVLFGCSRGAATTIITLANLDIEILKHIKLVIVEAPFDSVENVVNSSFYFPNFILNSLKWFTKYDENQQTPLDAVNSEKFPLNVPIAFVTSEVDTTVPIDNTMNLINVLKNRNHQHLHHLNLKNSHHALMHSHNPEDVNNYLQFVNNLYELYI